MTGYTARERRDLIVEQTLSSGLSSVDELSSRFEVTPSTIRRDLARLTANGRLARTYGGVIAGSTGEPSLRQRLGEAHEAKTAIARTAADAVSDGDVLLLDAGSTVGALAHELGRRDPSGLTVATVSLTVLDELSESDVTVECLGGRLRRLSQGFYGPLAEAALERISADAVFLGTDGVSCDGEICEADLAQTRLKELMARRADRVHVLAHGTKIGSRPYHACLRLPTPWTLITDSTAPSAHLERLERLGVTIMVAGSSAEPTAHSDGLGRLPDRPLR